ncbi:hypothetical protein D3C85_392430 [compost metagenome]
MVRTTARRFSNIGPERVSVIRQPSLRGKPSLKVRISDLDQIMVKFARYGQSAAYRPAQHRRQSRRGDNDDLVYLFARGETDGAIRDLVHELGLLKPAPVLPPHPVAAGLSAFMGGAGGMRPDPGPKRIQRRSMIERLHHFEPMGRLSATHRPGAGAVDQNMKREGLVKHGRGLATDGVMKPGAA